ncbi:MAG: hypothetical protein IJH43_00130 [Mogibacterium sp.]|nr:hypothetical protein [Mogibacterium sp.]
MKVYDEVWAVEANRVVQFFKEHRGDVTIITLPDKTVGSMTMPQTQVIIQGENADELYWQFRMHFMTAGG